MSDGIQKVAGGKMRQILSVMTSNRFTGVLTGFFITSVVQSSSATTVMVVSFVNAGLLTLIQSIGVIMGANIGTTVTAWLISVFGFGKFSIAAISLPVIAFGFPMLFINKEKIKYLGEVLIGFALLFMGLTALKDAVPDLKSNPEVLEFLSNFTDGGILSVMFFVLIGTIITVIVQSSSAAMALTLTLLNKEIITFDMAAAMVLGENIGTTITANLAAMIANVHAKRAAAAHFIFNMFGVIWVISIFPFFTKFINWLWGPFSDYIGSVNPEAMGNVTQMQLSLFHTVFNIINVILLIGLADFIAKIVTRMVKSNENDEDDELGLKFIGGEVLATPEISLIEAGKEVADFGEITFKMSGFVQDCIVSDNLKDRKKLFEKIKKYEANTDRLEVEISDYLVKVSSGELTKESSIQLRSILAVANDLEDIGDLFYQMSMILEKNAANSTEFEQGQKDDLLKMMKQLDEAFIIMNHNLRADSDEITMSAVDLAEKELNQSKSRLRKQYFINLEKGEFDVLRGTDYFNFFILIERIGNHIVNVSEAMTGQLAKDEEG